MDCYIPYVREFIILVAAHLSILRADSQPPSTDQQWQQVQSCLRAYDDLFTQHELVIEYERKKQPLPGHEKFINAAISSTETRTGVPFAHAPYDAAFYSENTTNVLKISGPSFWMETSNATTTTYDCTDGLLHLEFLATYERATLSNHRLFEAPLPIDYITKLPEVGNGGDHPDQWSRFETAIADLLSKNPDAIYRVDPDKIAILRKGDGNAKVSSYVTFLYTLNPSPRISRIEFGRADASVNPPLLLAPNFTEEFSDFIALDSIHAFPKSIVTTESQPILPSNFQPTNANSLDPATYPLTKVMQTSYTIKSIYVKDRDKNDFTITMPLGTFVYDELAGKSYRVGDGVKINANELKQIVNQSGN